MFKLIHPLSILLISLWQPLFAQFQFEETLLTALPQKTSNAAVCSAVTNDGPSVFVFGGIDESKIWSGIHRHAFVFNVASGNWTQLADIPDTAGKIAAAASVIKNKIYITGGYHVAANGNETSSNKVHVFNPILMDFETDAANLPHSIDDHVQAVWRDSLLFVISGWSNTGNVSYVQLYNPASNSWQQGTPVPSNSNFRAFGASGTIIGDTIYYLGGARSGANFPGCSFLRKGVINPLDPSQISWTQIDDYPGAAVYRAAGANYGPYGIWMGGSAVTYNYDGIAYNGSGGVLPTAEIRIFDAAQNLWFSPFPLQHAYMDLRGAAFIAPDKWILVGGMDSSQNVTDYVLQIKLNQSPLIISDLQPSVMPHLYPNPCSDLLQIPIIPETHATHLITLDGQVVMTLHDSESIVRVTALPSSAWYAVVYSNGFVCPFFKE